MSLGESGPKLISTSVRLKPASLNLILEAVASVEFVCVPWRKCKGINRWQVPCEVRAVLS